MYAVVWLFIAHFFTWTNYAVLLFQVLIEQEELLQVSESRSYIRLDLRTWFDRPEVKPYGGIREHVTSVLLSEQYVCIPMESWSV